MSNTNGTNDTTKNNQPNPVAYILAAAVGIVTVYFMMPDVFAMMVERVQAGFGV